MEKVINSYETMFIVSLANGEDAAKETVNKFTSLVSANAEVVQIDEWGKRRLAYPIQDMNEGYYTVVTYKSEGSFLAELDRLMNIDETVLRAMSIKLEYDAAAKAAAAPVEEVSAEETPVAEETATADAE